MNTSRKCENFAFRSGLHEVFLCVANCWTFLTMVLQGCFFRRYLGFVDWKTDYFWSQITFILNFLYSFLGKNNQNNPNQKKWWFSPQSFSITLEEQEFEGDLYTYTCVQNARTDMYMCTHLHVYKATHA